MKQRIITAVIGIIVGVTVIALNGTVIYPVFVALIAVLSVHEILTVCGCGYGKFPVHYIFCMAFAASMPILTYYHVPDIWRLFAASVIVFFMFAGYVADRKKLSFDKLAVMVTVSCLLSLSVTCLVSLRNMSEVHGICYVVMALMAAWVPDAGAYFVGTAIGKHKMCPDISPKKTIEGAVGGIIVTGIVFAGVGFCYRLILQKTSGTQISVNYPAIMAMAVAAAFISMVGDLTASLLKREYGIKDFGKLLPGHGGVVDRFDSVYFVLPYMMLVLNAFGGKIFVQSVS